MHSRRPNVSVRKNYLNQLTALEGRLFKDGAVKSNEWDIGQILIGEEQIVTNTYLNAQMTLFADYSNVYDFEIKRKISWIDEYN